MDCLPQLHLAAIHAPSEYDYNTFVPGIGATCIPEPESDVSFGGGVYLNSISRISVYVSGAWQPLNISGVRLGVMFGGATGYSHHVVSPIGGVYISYKIFNFLLAPASQNTPALIHVSLTLKSW